MRSGQDFIRSPNPPTVAIVFAIFFVSTAIATPGLFPSKTLAGAEGFEPPSPVLETGSLTVELTPLCQYPVPGCQYPDSLCWYRVRCTYFTSLCGVCFQQHRQNFFNSIRSGIVLRFFIFE